MPFYPKIFSELASILTTEVLATDKETTIAAPTIATSFHGLLQVLVLFVGLAHRLLARINSTKSTG